VADLGTDKIYIYHLDKGSHKLKKAAPVSEIKLRSGRGPRHMVFNDSKKLLYLACELSNTVSVADLSKADNHPVIATLSTLPNDYNEVSYVADIHMSKDGRFLYVSNRGLNTIAIFSVDPKDGKLELISQESTRGIYPRNFAFSPDEDFLLVANQKSQNIVAFKRNSDTGELTFTDEVKAFAPVCVLFY
jgi:6-phosphogluconolactonase